MGQVVIDNPILNSPFDEPTRHFRFTDEGITDEVEDGRRISSYFVPIARPKKKKGAAQQTLFDTEWTQDRIEENDSSTTAAAALVLQQLFPQIKRNVHHRWGRLKLIGAAGAEEDSTASGRKQVGW